MERLHRWIKESLTARGGQWIDELPWTLLGLRAVPCEDDGISSAEQVFGFSLVLPGSLLDFEEASTAELAQAFRDVTGGVPVRQPSTQPTTSPVPGMTHTYLRVMLFLHHSLRSIPDPTKLFACLAIQQFSELETERRKSISSA